MSAATQEGARVQAPVRLAQDALPALPEGVSRPRYDRASLRAGILHVGVGNFHRAHQAWYLHRLIQAGTAHDWAIIGAGVRPGDAGMRDRLLAQDCLTTLVELGADGIAAEVTGAMIDFLPVEEGNAPLIRAIAGAGIRILSLTVTEGGYYLDAARSGLDSAHPDIRHDAAHPESPRTVFGAIVAGLGLRRMAGHDGLTVMSCDNLRANGDITRRCVLDLARLSDPGLADWIEARCSFPNSMVDCIVPATGPREMALVRDLGIADAAPVCHESYRQWVIEDDFRAGRPPLEDVGVIFTDAVHDHETMKIRILNAGHQVLANAGELLGVETIAGCMAHPQIAGFFRKVQHDEIVPYVAPVPGIAPSDYAALIERRFANPMILDTARRVAFDGASRHPGFVLPILRDALAAGGAIEGLSLAEALWARMCTGQREDGTPIAPNDPRWDELSAAAQEARHRPMAWIEQQSIYGDLAADPRFAEAFVRWAEILRSEGCAGALQRYCGADGPARGR